MPLLSAFTPFGQLEFSSEPSTAEKIYRSLKAGYRHPETGEQTIDTSDGTHQEAKLYGWSIAIANASQVLQAAGNELRPERSYAQLEAHEHWYKLTPGPEESIAERRAALAAKRKASRGPRYEAMVDALHTLLGASFLAYRPIGVDVDANEDVSYPRFPAQGPGIFRRPDLPAKSVRLLTAITHPGVFGICDEYALANHSAHLSLDADSLLGQSFEGDGRRIARAAFELRRASIEVTGVLVAKVYAHAGTFGTTGVPIGVPLARSEPFSVQGLALAFAMIELVFAGPNRIVLVDGHHYFLVLEYTGGSPGRFLEVGVDDSTPTHAGNSAIVLANAWSSFAGHDLIFQIKTGFSQEVTYENWSRTQAEINLVRGDVMVVDPGNWGLAEKVTVIDSSGSGPTRTLTACFDEPHSANVYATTGTMPMWTSTKRHVLIVVTAAAAISVAMRAKINALLATVMRGPTTWDIVEPTSPGADTVGPFTLGESPLGAVPIGELSIDP
jgi:hypothetical protein